MMTHGTLFEMPFGIRSASGQPLFVVPLIVNVLLRSSPYAFVPAFAAMAFSSVVIVPVEPKYCFTMSRSPPLQQIGTAGQFASEMIYGFCSLVIGVPP